MHINGSVYLGLDSDDDVPDLHKPKISQVDFSKAEINGELRIRNAHVDGKLNLFGIRVGRFFEFSNSRSAKLSLDEGDFGKIELVYVELGHASDHDDLTLGALGSSSTHSVQILRSVTYGTVESSGAHINNELDIRGSNLKQLLLTSSMIDGELIMGQITKDGQTNYQSWSDKRHLGLEHTKVRILRSRLRDWPDSLDLNGLTYTAFAPPLDDKKYTPLLEELKQWIVKSVPFAPAGYKQLRSVLMNSGYGAFATEIGIQGRDKEREAAWDGGLIQDWLWLSMLKLFINYGYFKWWAIGWATLLTLAGTLVFYRANVLDLPDKHLCPSSTQAANLLARKSIIDYIVYSFDMLLPIIQLNKRNYDLEVYNWPRHYVIMHKIMGYIIGACLLAGLTGLLK